MKGIISLVLILLSFGLYFMYIGPTIVDISALSGKLSEYTTTLEKSKELRSRRDSILSAYNAIPADNLDRLEKVLPIEFNAVLLARDMSGIAAQSGIPLRGIKINSANKEEVPGAIVLQANKDPYRTAEVSFSVSGSYDQFMRFLNTMETSLRLVDVTSVSVKGSEKASVYDYAITLNSYSLR
jgi:Tfp pilus assembly protein PilO